MSNLKLVPSWDVAMDILIMVLESGTDQGKVMAREELKKLAAQVDAINASAEAPAEVHYTVPLQFTEIQLRYMDDALARAIEDVEQQIRHTNLEADYSLEEANEVRDLPDRYLGCRRAISVALEQLS